MRLAFFFGGLLGIAFTTYCFAHVPAEARDLSGNSDYDRLLALAFFCITLISLAFTYLCVKEVFAPRRTK